MNESTETTGNFAEMFESSLARMDKLKPGQAVKTAIVSISKDTVFLELSGKSEGVLDLAEVTDSDGKPVITSYSIHYTKLYERRCTGFSPSRTSGSARPTMTLIA